MESTYGDYSPKSPSPAGCTRTTSPHLLLLPEHHGAAAPHRSPPLLLPLLHDENARADPRTGASATDNGVVVFFFTGFKTAAYPPFEQDMDSYVYVRCLLQLLDQRLSKAKFGFHCLNVVFIHFTHPLNYWKETKSVL